MKNQTILTILLLTLLTFSCSLNFNEETTDFCFTLSREFLVRNGSGANSEYKVECFLTGDVNETQTKYLDETQKEVTFTFEKIKI